MDGMKKAYDEGHCISDWNHDFSQEMKELMTLYVNRKRSVAQRNPQTEIDR